MAAECNVSALQPSDTMSEPSGVSGIQSKNAAWPTPSSPACSKRADRKAGPWGFALCIEVETGHGVPDQGGEQHKVGVLNKQLIGGLNRTRARLFSLPWLRGK